MLVPSLKLKNKTMSKNKIESALMFHTVSEAVSDSEILADKVIVTFENKSILTITGEANHAAAFNIGEDDSLETHRTAVMLTNGGLGRLTVEKGTTVTVYDLENVSDISVTGDIKFEVAENSDFVYNEDLVKSVSKLIDNV